MIRLFRYLKPYRMPIALVLFFIFLQSISELYLPTLMADIVDTGIVNGDTGFIMRVGGYMLLVTAAGAAFSIGGSYLSAKVAAGFGHDVRKRLFAHVESFSLQEFDAVGTASLINRSTNDINQVQNVLIMMLRMMVMAPLMCIGGIIMAVSRDAELSLVLVAALPILALTIWLIASRGMPYFRMIQQKLDKLNLVLRENLTGIRVIRSFNRTAYETERFERANADVTETGVKAAQTMAAMMPAMMLIINLVSIAVIWFGGLRVDAMEMNVGDLMAFLQYAMQIMFSLMMLSMMFIMIPRAAVSASRINEVLDIVPAIRDDAPSAGAPAGGDRVPALRGIAFDGVTFRYPGAEMPALTNITFTAPPGEVTAIIGGTGAGKSTLLNLIMRYYTIEQGVIRIDGADIAGLPQQELRARIGYVPQQAVLFTGTVADNIRYGKEAATLEEIRSAAETAQAAAFIEALDGGYEANIAQGGGNLSGGQKQRLSIARALVRRPDVYLFDDSFSALDYRTDAKLRAALKDVTRDAAVLIVAQRVSTIKDADRIVVLNEGAVAGIGTHEELQASCEVYREIVASQLTEEESA